MDDFTVAPSYHDGAHLGLYCNVCPHREWTNACGVEYDEGHLVAEWHDSAMPTLAEIATAASNHVHGDTTGIESAA